MTDDLLSISLPSLPSRAAPRRPAQGLSMPNILEWVQDGGWPWSEYNSFSDDSTPILPTRSLEPIIASHVHIEFRLTSWAQPADIPETRNLRIPFQEADWQGRKGWTRVDPRPMERTCHYLWGAEQT